MSHRLRKFPFETQVFDKYSRVEKATRNAIVESYIQGVSTRRIKEIVLNLGIEKLSATSASNIAKELDKNKANRKRNKISFHRHKLFQDKRM
jgi:putative transposase